MGLIIKGTIPRGFPTIFPMKESWDLKSLVGIGDPNEPCEKTDPQSPLFWRVQGFLGHIQLSRKKTPI